MAVNTQVPLLRCNSCSVQWHKWVVGGEEEESAKAFVIWKKIWPFCCRSQASDTQYLLCISKPEGVSCHHTTKTSSYHRQQSDTPRRGQGKGGGGVEGITHTFDTAWPFTWNRRSAGLETLRCYLRTESQSTVQLLKQDCIKVFHTVPTAQYLMPTDSQGLHQSVSHTSYSTILNTNWQSRTASKCFTHFLQHNSQYQVMVKDCIKMFHTPPTAQYLIPTNGQGLHQSVSQTSYSTILNTNWWSRLLQCKGLTDLRHDQAKNKLATPISSAWRRS